MTKLSKKEFKKKWRLANTPQINKEMLKFTNINKNSKWKKRVKKLNKKSINQKRKSQRSTI